MSVVMLFFIVLIAAFAAFAYFMEPSKADKLTHARLFTLDRKATSEIEDEGSIVKEITYSRIATLDAFLRENRFARAIQLLIEQSALDWTVGKFISFTLAALAAGALVGTIWVAQDAMGAVPGLVAAAAPYLYLLYKRNQRFTRFAELLPDAIDLMARGLRAGQALPAALDLVAREAGDPVGTEFRRAADEQSFGLPFREAMLNLNRRVVVPDLQFLITAILVQKETGGNLVAILEKTAALIRERGRVIGQTRVRTAQGRITGWVMCSLPIAMLLLLNFMNPGYTDPLFDTPEGRKWVWTGLFLMMLGVFSIRRIVTVKV